MPITAATTIAAIMAISVVMNGASVGSGSIVAPGDFASSTPIAVSAYDIQYDCEPSNVAIIVYSPGTGGSHISLNIPLASLVTVPIS